MALFIDGNISQLADLRDYEAGILDMAKSADVDLSAKMAMAAGEIGSTITAFLRANPAAAAGAELAQVVLNEEARRCHRLRTLALAYRDAAASQASDRYEKQYLLYDALYQQAIRKYLENGVGVVSQPLPAAPPPTASYIDPPGPTQTLYVRASWTNGDGSESEASEVLAVDPSNGSGIELRVSNAPAGATGWKVYAGWAPGATKLQTDVPLACGAQWELHTNAVRNGALPGDGQVAQRWVRAERRLQRG